MSEIVKATRTAYWIEQGNWKREGDAGQQTAEGGSRKKPGQLEWARGEQVRQPLHPQRESRVNVPVAVQQRQVENDLQDESHNFPCGLTPELSRPTTCEPVADAPPPTTQLNEATKWVRLE